MIKTTKGDGVHFRNPTLDQLNQEWQEYQAEYEEKQKEFTKILIDACG